MRGCVQRERRPPHRQSCVLRSLIPTNAPQSTNVAFHAVRSTVFLGERGESVTVRCVVVFKEKGDHKHQGAEKEANLTQSSNDVLLAHDEICLLAVNLRIPLRQTQLSRRPDKRAVACGLCGAWRD